MIPISSKTMCHLSLLFAVALVMMYYSSTAHGIEAEPSNEVQVKRAAEKQFSDPDVAALAVAAAIGGVNEIDRLVEKGVNVNAASHRGMTPLFFSLQWNCYSGNKAIKTGFKRLLEHGANADYHIVPHKLATHEDRQWASSSCQRERSILFLAASSFIFNDSGQLECDSEWLELLLKYGANPNLVYPGCCDAHDCCAGWTPIFEVIDHGNLRGVDLLIKAGADVNHQDNKGDSPLVRAAFQRHFDIVNRLLEAGADYRIKNNQGKDLAYMIVQGSCVWRRSSIAHDSAENPELAKTVAFLEKKGVDFKTLRVKVEKDWE